MILLVSRRLFLTFPLWHLNLVFLVLFLYSSLGISEVFVTKEIICLKPGFLLCTVG